MKYYRKDWILFQEVVNDGGKLPEDLIEVKAKEGNADEDRHIPFIIKNEEGYEVKVGKNSFHPVDEKHYIIFVDLHVDGQTFRKYFKKGDTPVAQFNVAKGKKVTAFAFCNLHGLYKNTLGK